MQNFSLNTALLKDIFQSAKPLGHNEKPDNLNLGFGFLYYGMARALRPKHLLVIGSGFGFSVVCFALGIKDNGDGMLTFVDPSYSLLKNGPFKTIGGTDKWSEPQKVQAHFHQFGVDDIVTHYKLRSDQFFASFKALGLPPIDIAFIDGSHAYENVKHDFLHTIEHTHKNSYILAARLQHLYAGNHRPCRRQEVAENYQERKGIFRTDQFPLLVGHGARPHSPGQNMEVCEKLVLPVIITLALVVTGAICYLFWRYVWFFRNPHRTIPPDGSGILSPADGTVVYARQMKPRESVINIKRGTEATLDDITMEDMTRPKILIGIFMSPFNVHYNRIPVSGTIRFIHHHTPSNGNVCMLWMHLRTLFRRPPLYKDSTHILLNERTVTRIDGEYRGDSIGCYVVQIAAKSVSGIDVYASEGQKVSAGEIYGMIRIGSQVDVVVTLLEGMKIRVFPGQRVRAGQTVLID